MGKRQKTYEQLLNSVHKSFRKKGYTGAGVDGLASSAGLTSGAFYSHFGSKAQAFRESLALGITQFRDAVTEFQSTYGDDWLKHFSRFYLGEKRSCDLSESCVLQSLSSDVTRMDGKTKHVFQSEILEAVEKFSDGLNNATAKDAWPILAMLIGGSILARAVEDKKLSNQIAKSIQEKIIQNLP